MKRGNVASWLFLLAWALSMVAALGPLLGGRPINVTFLGVSVVFLVLGVATARKKDGGPPEKDSTSEQSNRR